MYLTYPNLRGFCKRIVPQIVRLLFDCYSIQSAPPAKDLHLGRSSFASMYNTCTLKSGIYSCKFPVFREEIITFWKIYIPCHKLSLKLHKLYKLQFSQLLYYQKLSSPYLFLRIHKWRKAKQKHAQIIFRNRVAYNSCKYNTWNSHAFFEKFGNLAKISSCVKSKPYNIQVAINYNYSI